MAKGVYEELYKQLKSEREARQSALKKSGANSSTSSDVQTKINNLKTRLEAGGVDVDKATDKRNVIEKALGLPEDQNFIFDLFELLGRPQQALFGGIKASQEGGDLNDSLKAAWEHFKGDDETQFKEILMNSDLDFEDRKGKMDWVDVLGFAGDVLLDPADWALFAAAVPTGGTSLAGVAANNISDVGKVVNAAGDASKAIDAGKLVMNTEDAARMASKLEKATEKGAKVVRKSLSDLALEGIGNTVKGTVKFADNNVSKALKHLDETKGVISKVDNLADEAADVVKLGYTNNAATSAADLGKYVKNSGELRNALEHIPKGRLEKYVELKESVTNAFKLPDRIKEVIRTASKNDTITDNAKKRINNFIKEYSDDVAANAEKIGMSVDEINEAMTDMIEYKGLNRIHKGSEIIEAGKRGALVANDENIKIIEELANDINKAGRTLDGEPFQLTYKVKGGQIWLDKNWSKGALEKVDGGAISFNPEILQKEFEIASNYTPDDLKRLKKLEKNKEFMSLYERNKDLSVKLNNVIDEEFGKGFVKKFAKNEGYVPHSFTGIAKNTRVTDFLTENDIMLKGNRKVMSERTRLGSVLEENNLYNTTMKENYDNLTDAQKAFVDKNSDIFERNFQAAMSKKYLDDLPTLLKNDKNVTEILVEQSLGDIDGMVKLSDDIKKASLSGDKDTMVRLADEFNKKYGNSNIKVIGVNGEVPKGYTAIGKNGGKIADKIEDMAKQLGDANVAKLTKQLRAKGEELVIDNYVLNLLEVSSKNVGPIERMTNKYLNFYKKWKVASPTYFLNNLTGNMSNMWLSGIDITDQAKYFPDAYKIYNEGPKLLMKRAAGEALDAADARIVDLYEKLAKEGFTNSKITQELRDMPESVRKYFSGDKSPKTLKEMITDGIPYLNGKMNEQMDTMSRAVVMLKSLDDPSYLARLGVDNFGDAIRKVMFDPKEITMVEKNIMSKYIPFYTFAKKNLAFQLDNLGRNGGRYHKLMKSIRGLQDLATDGNSENMEEYIKNNLYIPIPGLAEDGSYTVIRTQLPFGNLLDLASDPLGGALNMLGPVKAPFEFALNKNLFTGADIESYPGQKSNNIPFLTRKAEHALGSFTGLDVPLKTASRVYKGIDETMQNGGGFFEGLGRGALNTVTMQQNINNDELSRMYDELDELELLMKQYKGMGYEFATMNELKKANPNKVTSKINAQLNKLYGIEGSMYQ